MGRAVATKRGLGLEISEGKHHTKIRLAGRRWIIVLHSEGLKTNSAPLSRSASQEQDQPGRCRASGARKSYRHRDWSPPGGPRL